jgi:hypothetical protein
LIFFLCHASTCSQYMCSIYSLTAHMWWAAIWNVSSHLGFLFIHTVHHCKIHEVKLIDVCALAHATLPQKKWTLRYSNNVGQCTLASLIGLA